MRLSVWKRKEMISGAVAELGATPHETIQCRSFLALMEQYEQALRRLAGAYVAQAADREDLFQEIAVAIWQAIPRFRGEASERTWLYRIAHNVAISSAARLRRKMQREESIPESFDRPSQASDEEQDLLSEEKRRLLIDSVRDLPAVDRQIVLLHLEGLSHAEIEEVTGMSETAIATRLTRIREKLKARIHRTNGGNQ